MNSKIFPPSEKLKEYVFCYITLEADYTGVGTEVSMDIYPNGLSGISFSYGDVYGYENTNGQQSNFGTGAAVIGLHNGIFRLIPSGKQKHFVITFKPGVLSKLLKTPMYELYNQVADLDCFMAGKNEIPERLSEANDIAQQIGIVETWLLKKVAAFDFYHDITGCVLSDIVSSAGNLKIEELCKEYSINKKYIERKFKESIGILPKQYSEIIRLNSVINTLISAKEKQWFEISAETGFTDYSHLNKHISKWTNLSPQMLKQKLYHSYSNGLLINNDLGLLNTLCIMEQSFCS